jgi:glycine reductase complex component B subunit gamma
MGIATVFVTALPTVASMVGANRILHGVSITSPTGDPSRSPEEERRFRRMLVERAMEFLEAPVARGTVWEIGP